MSDIKRAQLIPLGPQRPSDKAPKDSRKTVRIAVVLPESNEDTCPEYNYKDELAAAKKRGKYKEISSVPNGVNRLEDSEDNDDDVRRIAREMEEKYGTGVSLNKKKRKGRKDDYADIGMGYDESDSFIDNTDGYDEMIPQNVTTLHGGFYINSGALEFKTDDEASSDISSSSSDDEEDSKKTSRKRIIESSDETDREIKTESLDNEKHVEKKRKLQNGGNGMQQSLKKKLLGQQNKIYIKKRRLLDPQKKTVKELLREKRVDLNMTIPPDLADARAQQKNDDDAADKKEKNMSNVSDTIEAVVKAAVDTKSDLEEMKTDKVIAISSSDESSHDNNKKINDVKLPENLPVDIVEVIATIRDAYTKNTDKINVFTPTINSLLLKLERKCKCLAKPSKMKVYEHVSVCLNCKPEVLIRKSKALILNDEQQRIKSLLNRLQNEINRIMPSLLEGHEKESQRILQKKFSLESIDNEDNKSLRMPKRRFQWNDLSKKVLKDILMIKKRCFLLEGKQKEALDEQMLNFLKCEIQILWPEGWMSMNALNKIYTTYADPKRLSNINNNGNNNSNSANDNNDSNNPILVLPTTTATATTTTTTTTTKVNIISSTMKNLSFNNSNLSITPIVSVVSSGKSDSGKINELVVQIDSEKKSLPETDNATTRATSPKKDVECKLKLKPASELLKPSVMKKVESQQQQQQQNFVDEDTVIIVDSVTKAEHLQKFGSNKDKNKSDDNYCQVIDLSDKNDFNKLKNETKTKTKSNENHLNKHLDLSITPSYPSTSPNLDHSNKTKTSCPAGDDIQKVMEDLKVLQKMSSPKKCLENSPTSSAVSVIAVNKSFAPKTHQQRTPDYNKSDFNSSFQDEFQKQLYSAINHITTSASKSNYNSIDRFPHIASSGSTPVTTDKYFQPFQNSNNNYTQNSNGHKNTTSTPQQGTYSILDDMFANLLTQYGYAKEASTPKSQQK